MAKYQKDDVKNIAQALRKRKAHFLIGAGCSITAGIPGAAALVEQINNEYAHQVKEMSLEDRKSYGKCMGILAENERSALLKPHFENAKVNWGSIALAQLIKEGFVTRVLTLNFDLVLEKACALLGIQPAVYDFGVAPSKNTREIAFPSIIHLHGQSYGLVRLNGERETEEHRQKVAPIVEHSLLDAPMVVIGYSGSSDGISQTIFERFDGRDRLWWAGYRDDPDDHLKPLSAHNVFKFLGGVDFDRFMIEIATDLGCWPPQIITNPILQLLEELAPVVPYPTTLVDNVDLLRVVRLRLSELGNEFEARRGDVLQKLSMQGEYRFDPTPEDKNKAAWSLVISARRNVSEAKTKKEAKAAELLGLAERKLRKAIKAQPDMSAAFNSLGNVNLERARRATDSELRSRMWSEAENHYTKALELAPLKFEPLNGLANLFTNRAIVGPAENFDLYSEMAEEKYRKALEIEPFKHAPLYSFGNLLMQKARRETGQSALRLFEEAKKKLGLALKIDPTKTYNHACLAALQGDVDACRRHLENAERHKTLPRMSHVQKDPDLDSVRDFEWFKDLMMRID